MNVLHFLQYHNAVPIAVSVMLLGAGATFAATNPEAIYSEEQHVLSIDNTYIVNKDLASWSPQIRIGVVTEDSDNYYVAYALSTIDLDGFVWRDVTKEVTITISKAELGEYRDLGVYVTEQLKQIIESERLRLTDTQEIERRQVSLASVATVYSGLVGQFLDESTVTLPGYVPVVTEPVIAGAPSDQGSSQPVDTGGSVVSAQIGLQVLGNNPARIPVGTAYGDLGVALIDPLGTNVGVHIFVGGREVTVPSLDTSTSTSYAIEYRATDRNDVSVMVRRIVIVGDAPDPGGAISEAGNVAPLPPPSAPQASTPPIVEPQETETATSTETESATTTQETPPEEEPTEEAPAVEEEPGDVDVVPDEGESVEAATEEPEEEPAEEVEESDEVPEETVGETSTSTTQ